MRINPFVWVVPLLAAAFWIGQSRSALPEGPGRGLVLQKCQSCHDLVRVTHERRTRERWNGVITEMESFGLRLTPPERASIQNYLATHLAPGAKVPAAPPAQAATPASGDQVYNSCIGCHQATGVGIPGVSPPWQGMCPEFWLFGEGANGWFNLCFTVYKGPSA